MLKSLYIENFAVIAKTEISLCDGFNVFTGETGAGKTILIGALGAALGARVGRDIIRTGESRAMVSAVFCDLSPEAKKTMEALGYTPEEDGTLLVSRSIRPDSSDCRIGGAPATATMLKAIAPFLLDVHGQHDNGRLLSPEYHLSLIDHFGGLKGLVSDYEGSYKTMRECEESLSALQMDEGERARRIGLLEYQADEIEKAAFSPGEEEELCERLALMRNAEKITEALERAKSILDPEYSEESGIAELLGELIVSVALAAKYIPELAGADQRLLDMQYELTDLGSELSSQLENIEFSPQELDDSEARLSLLHSLKIKYGADIPEILRFAERAREELEGMELSQERLEELTQSLESARAEAGEKARRLTQERQSAAERFVSAVESELCYLDMPSVRLKAQMSARALGPTGEDLLELLISSNAGEVAKPLQKVASGGEIARIMLSIKNVLTEESDGVTSVFDEVDTGVSGRAADKIGQKLAAVAGARQVLCVTHLAQVAAYADNHLLIKKITRDERTFTEVKSLSGEERVSEIARIVSGDRVTDAARQNAVEMLKLAQGKKDDF